MSDELYREVILEHWRNPQNFGKLDKPDFFMDAKNPYCGDQIAFTGKIKNRKIHDIKFAGEGCAISVASASIFTEHVKGMKIKEVLDIKQEDYLKIVGMELGHTRIKCSLLVYSALITSLTSMALTSDNNITA